MERVQPKADLLITWMMIGFNKKEEIIPMAVPKEVRNRFSANTILFNWVCVEPIERMTPKIRSLSDRL